MCQPALNYGEVALSTDSWNRLNGLGPSRASLDSIRFSNPLTGLPQRANRSGRIRQPPSLSPVRGLSHRQEVRRHCPCPGLLIGRVLVPALAERVRMLRGRGFRFRG